MKHDLCPVKCDACLCFECGLDCSACGLPRCFLKSIQELQKCGAAQNLFDVLTEVNEEIEKRLGSGDPPRAAA